MTIEDVKTNIMQERRLIDNMLLLTGEITNTTSSKDEKDFFAKAVKALEDQVRIINNSLPDLLARTTIETAELPPPNSATVQMSQGFVTIKNKEKKKFIAELQISEDALRKVRKRKKVKVKKETDMFRKPSAYVSTSSRLFSKFSFALSARGFKNLHDSLRRANMPYLLNTYISIMLFTSFVVLIASLVLSLFLSFFHVTLVVGNPLPALVPLPAEDLLARLVTNVTLALFAPLIILLLFYVYPITQANSISQRIDNELPFAVIHMSSIAGSGVEPSKIFQILGLSKEYPAISKEMRKLVNQVNLYGYDLVNALRTTAKATSSGKLQDLLNGLATNIAEGGDMKSYLEKKGADTLLDYKLERKKDSSIAETSMDIYIGILIAAPMILMVMLILMNLTGIGVALDQGVLTLMITGGISLLNIGFLIFLKFRQPV